MDRRCGLDDFCADGIPPFRICMSGKRGLLSVGKCFQIPIRSPTHYKMLNEFNGNFQNLFSSGVSD